MDGIQDAEKSVVVCVETCSIPSLNVIAQQSERREVKPDLATLLVATGKFRLDNAAKAQSASKTAVVQGFTELLQEDIEITDAALTLAERHGVDLSKVAGTGVDGKILKSDVAAYIEEE